MNRRNARRKALRAAAATAVAIGCGLTTAALSIPKASPTATNLSGITKLWASITAIAIMTIASAAPNMPGKPGAIRTLATVAERAANPHVATAKPNLRRAAKTSPQVPQRPTNQARLLADERVTGQSLDLSAATGRAGTQRR